MCASQWWARSLGFTKSCGHDAQVQAEELKEKLASVQRKSEERRDKMNKEKCVATLSRSPGSSHRTSLIAHQRDGVQHCAERTFWSTPSRSWPSTGVVRGCLGF
jgi:hypothetical protein